MAWAVYFAGFRALRSLRLAINVLTFGRVPTMPQPLRWLCSRLSRVESKSGDQMIILFKKRG